MSAPAAPFRCQEQTPLFPFPDPSYPSQPLTNHVPFSYLCPSIKQSCQGTRAVRQLCCSAAGSLCGFITSCHSFSPENHFLTSQGAGRKKTATTTTCEVITAISPGRLSALARRMLARVVLGAFPAAALSDLQHGPLEKAPLGSGLDHVLTIFPLRVRE